MSQTDHKIQVEPKDELVFNGPFDRVVSSKIKLTNPGTEKYYFKVKTTVPKSYCVKPSCGYIDPSGSVNVEILLQPVSVNQSDKNKHKFMIQFLQVPSGDNIDIEKLWKDPASKVEDFKLKCVMKQPDEIIEIDPSTNIIFEGPFTSPVTSYIKINNSSNNPLCFKIQTTTPKKYSVTPNTGLVEPQQSQFVSVTLHQFDYSPTEQYKERFLLQYVVTPDVTAYRESVWTDFANKKVEYILKSVYQMPNDYINPTASGVLNSSSNTVGDERKMRSEIEQLKSKLATAKENENRLRKMTMETGNLQSGAAPRDAGFLANNAMLFTIIALILGAIMGKFFV